MLIHEMLEETAKRYPQNIAVKHGDETITFEELNEQSTKLATFFYEHEVKEGDRIALITEKSIESVIYIFGILKAGAMYVPIDPLIPIERLEYILKDCNVDIGLTSSKIIEKDKNVRVSEDASAYIMYTSGSTGEPKGVEIYHHSVTNLMNWYCKEFKITAEDKILSFVPLWFDASICDLFAMAKTGATLILPPEGINMFPNEFAQFLVDEQISLFFAPSSQFVLALPALKTFEYPYMKTVMFGAEELPIKYVKELQTVFKNSELVNIYGPTECTDVVTFYRVPKEIPEDMQKIPIGKPYHGIGVFLYKDNEIYKVGDVGELIIYGSNLMRRYWNKQEESDKVLKYYYEIIPTDFIEVYLTGDLAYKNSNGDYVYVGRKDRQIKSMGRRIQLEEIEHVLNEHPRIKEAVVIGIADKDVPLHINIVSYVVSSLTESEIIEHCRNKLPEYMVPTKGYICDSLSKTRNGKLNRNIK